MSEDDSTFDDGPFPFVPMASINTFVKRHECTAQQQILQLQEEHGEFAEAVNTDADDEEVAEELADIVFVALTLGIIYDVNVLEALHEVTIENLEKDGSTEGNKVTKE